MGGGGGYHSATTHGLLLMTHSASSIGTTTTWWGVHSSFKHRTGPAPTKSRTYGEGSSSYSHDSGRVKSHSSAAEVNGVRGRTGSTPGCVSIDADEMASYPP